MRAVLSSVEASRVCGQSVERKKAGLDWLRLHDLRHGFATSLLAQRVPPRAIMEVLGHAEIGVTMNTYTHVLPELRQEAADAIDELFGEPE